MANYPDASHLSAKAQKRNADILRADAERGKGEGGAAKARQRKAKPEKELHDEIVSRLQELGYKVAYFRPAKVLRGGVEKYETPIGGDGKGYPDITAVGHNRVLVLELKSETGTVKPEQLNWLRAWQTVPGATVMVVRPSTWKDLEPLL